MRRISFAETIDTINSRPAGLRYLLGFIIWPFGTMLLSLRHWRSRWSMNIFWLFCIFLGVTFAFGSDIPDSARHAKLLKEFHDSGTTLSELIKSIYTPGGGYLDIAQPIITWFVSLFTSNSALLLGSFGLIFGFFYSRNLWYLLDKIDGSITPVLFIFILTFALINPIWYINGFRMWTAAQIFIFSVLPYLVEGKGNRLWLLILAVFFHFSFVFPVLIFLGYVLIKNRPRFYLLFFILTFFVETINLIEVRQFLDFLPEFLGYKVETYTNPQYAARVAQDIGESNMYFTLSGQMMTYTIFIFTLLIFFLKPKFLEGAHLNLFCFGTWFYGWSNIASLVPSGGRFLTLATMIMFFLIIIYLRYTYENKLARFFSIISIPGLILFISVSFRMGFEFMSMSTIAGNPILSMFYHNSTPLIVYIKELF
jgi:hypothetical protein